MEINKKKGLPRLALVEAGLTLTELLIVISIIAFLAILIVAYLRSQVFKGNDARRKADLKRIGVAVEEYEKDKNCYPLPSLLTCNPGKGLLPYLNKIPCDPVTDATYLYDYEDSVCPRWYRIYGKLENEQDPDGILGIGPNSAYNFEYSSPNAPEIVSSGVLPSGAPAATGSPVIVDNFYGCVSGACVAISWDPTRPGPICDPNYQNSTCYGQCANPDFECKSWK